MYSVLWSSVGGVFADTAIESSGSEFGLPPVMWLDDSSYASRNGRNTAVSSEYLKSRSDCAYWTSSFDAE